MSAPVKSKIKDRECVRMGHAVKRRDGGLISACIGWS